MTYVIMYIYARNGRRYRVKIKRNYLKTIATVIIPFMFSGTKKTMRLLGTRSNLNIIYATSADQFWIY